MSNVPEHMQDDQDEWRAIREPDDTTPSPERFIDPRLLALDRVADAATTTVTVTAQPTPGIDNYLAEPPSNLQYHATDHKAAIVASSSTASDTGGETLLWQQHLASASRDSALPESGRDRKLPVPMHDQWDETCELSELEQDMQVHAPDVCAEGDHVTNPSGEQSNAASDHSLQDSSVSCSVQSSSPTLMFSRGGHAFYHPLTCSIKGCTFGSSPLKPMRKDHLSQHIRKKHSAAVNTVFGNRSN